MKNLIKAALLVTAICLLFIGCQDVPSPHQHEWQDATCTTPKTCDCGKTEGEALDHQGGEASCTQQAVCSRCGVSYGDTLAHTPGDAATCTTAQTCTKCPYVFVDAYSHPDEDGDYICDKEACKAQLCLNHTWNNATCKVPATCAICGTAKDNVLGAHNFANGVCSVCGEKEVVGPQAMPTATYELKNPAGTGVWCHEAGPQTYELAAGVTMTVNGEARFISNQVQLCADSYCDFVFPGPVSKITFTGTAGRDIRIFVSMDGGENWITVKRVSSIESTTVDLVGSFQYVRIINRSGSQYKFTSITVNPTE